MTKQESGDPLVALDIYTRTAPGTIRREQTPNSKWAWLRKNKDEFDSEPRAMRPQEETTVLRERSLSGSSRLSRILQFRTIATLRSSRANSCRSTTQSQRRRPRDAPIATAMARRRSLQCIVRPQLSKLILILYPFLVCIPNIKASNRAALPTQISV